MKQKLNIDVPEIKIEEFCRKYNIVKFSFFGSVIREDFNKESDVDVLVEFNKVEVVGFLKMAKMEMELSEILGHKVDLRTPAELSRYFREEVINSAEVQYAEG